MNDADGLVVRRIESDNNTSQADPNETWYRFNGREMTFNGNNSTENVDYDTSAQRRTATQGTGAFIDGATTATPYTDIDGSYDAINSYRQGSAGAQYTVRAGDSLQSIAQGVWGDASLWYKIADANGLTGDAPLVAGSTLSLPAGVTRTHNNASAFKPYDPSETAGNTSPTAPLSAKPPKHNGCGVFGQILLVAIAVAVTVVTSGAAIAAATPGLSSLSRRGTIFTPSSSTSGSKTPSTRCPD